MVKTETLEIAAEWWYRHCMDTWDTLTKPKQKELVSKALDIHNPIGIGLYGHKELKEVATKDQPERWYKQAIFRVQLGGWQA